MMNRTQNYGSISTPTVGFSGEQQQSSEFNSYCDNVVTNIYTINSSLKTLESALKNIGTKKDNQGLRNKIHVTQLSTNQIASATSKDLNKLKSIVAKGEKQKQLQIEKLAENFKDAINRYHTLQKEVANKQKAHLLISASIENEVAQEDDYNNQQQEALAREMAFEQDMLLEREARIKQIEEDVLDINEIMKDLGTLVHAQGEAIDTIENCIDHAAGSVEEGNEQLIKASRYQTRFRKKLLCLVLLGIIILAIIIGVLVSQLKK